MLAFATVILAFSSPATAVDTDVGVVMAEITNSVEASEHTPTLSLLSATETCENLLSQTNPAATPSLGWALRLQFETGSIYTKNGMFIMHVMSDDDFPQSCGVIAIPSESYHSVKKSFAEKYGTLTTPEHAADRDRLFPTATLSSAQYSYRLRSAEKPETALAITVRHKE